MTVQARPRSTFIGSLLRLTTLLPALLTIFETCVQGREPITVQMATDLALSPDGKTLAFAWSNDIWCVPIEGGTAVRLTIHSGKDSQPKFSPDGKQLMFISDRSDSDQIYIMPAAGGIPEQKTHHSEGYSIADWFPDGESMLAIGQRDHFWRAAGRLLQVKLNERAAEKLLLDDAASQAALSHDGSKILFVREGERWWRKGYRGERSGQIWMLDLATNETEELLHEGTECLWPMWMADDSGFYFTKGDASGFDLWSYKFPKKEDKPARQKRLAGFDSDSIVKPCIARDGSMIVFRHLFDLYSWSPNSKDPPQKINITIENDIGLRDDQISSTMSRADEVAFTDDGLEIAFAAGGDLWVMDSELREPIQITRTDGYEGNPLFSSDCKTLYFTREVEGQVDVWHAKPKADDEFWWQQTEFVETRLTQSAGSKSDLTLSPDGKKLFYQLGRGDLVMLDLESKEAIVLIDGFSPIDFSISHDGAWIAYASQDEDFNSEVWLLPTDRKQPPVNVSRHPDNDDSPVFSPDGKILAFRGRRSAEETDVYYVYLREEDDDLTSRDRKLEKAIEAMKKRKAADSKRIESKSTPETSAKVDTATDADEAKSTDTESKKDDKQKEPPTIEPMNIDLEKIHERVRRINLPNTSERDMVFSPDSKKLAFSATVDGKSGWYSVEFTDKIEPKLMSSTVLSQARWTKSSGSILGMNRGVPAKLEGGEKLTDFAFSIQHERSHSGRMREGFNVAWRLMGEIWYDSAMGGNNWDAIRRKYETAASQVFDERGLAEVVELMLGELNGSHLGFTPGVATADPEPATEPSSGASERSLKATAHLGLRFDESYKGPGLRVRDVLPGGPTDQHARKLKAGDIVLAIDGSKVDPMLDLTEVLNGTLQRDITLTIQSADDQPKEDAEAPLVEQTITIRPISYRRARALLYDHWLEHNRALTEKLSAGKLGYLHIRAMDTSSLLEFERQLYNVGYGRDGLIIDVRDNGGGSTTDHLLTALTQPRHALTIPRGGQIGYPHDRMVYATWSKPIVVLCNQNSYSNAEIFSHAIKVLGRGKLVGVQTAGGVVSTGVARVVDVGVLRAPFRGWFSIKDGKDMELNGAMPDVVIWPKPGELPQGIDRQLAEALKILQAEVAKAESLPKPKYATEAE